MISRYSRKELVNIWSEENKYRIWLNVEVAAAEAMEKYNLIPKGVSSIVKEKIESYAHSEHNNDKFKNPEHIANCQKTGADLFHRKVKSKKVERNFFPENLLKLMDQNPEFYFGKNN